MTEPTKVPSPTVGDKVVGALSRGAFILLQGQKSAWLPQLQSLVANTINAGVSIVVKNFPTQSLEERAFAGPIKSLLTKSAPDIVSAVNSNIGVTYDAVTKAFESRATAANQ